MLGMIRSYAGITLGSVLTAIALNMFLVPNKVAAGGVSGIATVLHYLAGFPVGVTMLVLNIPLFLASVKVLGHRFGIKTLYGAAILSVAIDLSSPFTPVLTHDLLLSSLFGGILCGIGMGLVFRFGGTTAGTDLAAAIINYYTRISVGRCLLAVDFCVITSAGIAFESAELSLYALISLFLTSYIIDLIQIGPSSAKAFLVVSQQSQAIAQGIMKDLERGVTLFPSRGGYSGVDREVLLCIVNTSEVTPVKEIIRGVDPQAFVIVADTHEVLGEGFTRTA